MIRYKVVTNDRYSTTIDTARKYRKHYLKGKTVKATEGTLGIFVFDNLMHAECFQGKISGEKILRVKTTGKGKRVSCICSIIEKREKQLLDAFYKGLKFLGDTDITIWAPQGTICYPAVKVLE